MQYRDIRLVQFIFRIVWYAVHPVVRPAARDIVPSLGTGAQFCCGTHVRAPARRMTSEQKGAKNEVFFVFVFALFEATRLMDFSTK